MTAARTQRARLKDTPLGTPPGGVPSPTIDEPIRAELFSVERLEQHAESLAAAQHVSFDTREAREHAPRLEANSKVLTEAHRAVVEATRARQPLTPSAEWLLDNFHVVDEQVREVKEDLPPGFYRLLPKLADGPLAGYPRVFGIAWALVAHTDSALDLTKLTRFVAAYQRVQPLTIGELWAVAITLRIMLVENLRRLAEAIVLRLENRGRADRLADRALAMPNATADAQTALLRDLDQSPWSRAFAVQLSQRLRDQDPRETPALQWLNKKLAAAGTTTDEIVQSEVQRQSVTNVTVRNIITSMRLISTVNWADWFESVCPVDALLRADSDFAAMDFPTRDLYRRAIEDLARHSGQSEIEVTEQALALAEEARAATPDLASPGADCDPGYYLISHGRPAFERSLNYRVAFIRGAFRFYAHLGILGYVGSILAIGAVALGCGLLAAHALGVAPWQMALLALAGAIPASDVALAVINRVITQKVGARLLPCLELRDGVPPELRTMIVVPTLLTNARSIAEQVKSLEVHYLSNVDDGLHFALLSDWTDSPTESASSDQELLALAAEGIARLNERYGPATGGARFLLLHRRRVWNDGEGKWMGWERKRGKLQELNRLLRGATDTTFLDHDGVSARIPQAVRYVITLDADTRMPIGAARRLIGKIAHPLVRPRFDPAAGLVVEGHGILQPRVTPSLPVGTEGSLFQRTFSGPNGLDPYAFAVSDVYQDLFEEGSFVGKGIYEVDTIESAMEGRIPENTVLSHDLLEGIFTRAGLASDIEVVEEFPARYDVAAARHHRWTRGDWQLLPWILGWARSARGRESLPAVGRWKLLDNLRRSLSAPSTLLAFILGWLLPPHQAMAWTGFVLFTIAFPSLVPVFAGLVVKRPGVSIGNHLRGLGADLALGLLQSGFQLVFLAHQAWLMLDAIGRTLYRTLVSRRRLLEWTTAAQMTESALAGQHIIWRQVAASAIFSVVLFLLIAAIGHGAGPIALPFAFLWIVSPIVAWRTSLAPPAEGLVAVKEDRARALRLVARRTWRFFETFVTEADQHLPPDNFQETPQPAIAHRTSPTNIGLYLLSVIAARDFAWLGTLECVERLEATLATLRRLEWFRGHLYNWYETQDLRALEPKYISTVDSGNLAGHLIALGQACRELAQAPAIHPAWRAGVTDALDIVRESLAKDPGVNKRERARACDALAEVAARPAGGAVALAAVLEEVRQSADALHVVGQAGDAADWCEALRRTIRSHRNDFETLMPWAAILARSPARTAEVPLLGELAASPSLARLPELCAAAAQRLEPESELAAALNLAAGRARNLLDRLEALAEAFRAMACGMEFGFLYDKDRQLLSIGYRAADGSLDSNCYDLLASEARLASYFAIAKGDVPARHWFRMGRTLTSIKRKSGLISWSGSMFEYLMPSLVMLAPSGSLLERTNQLVVDRQIDYGRELGIPWGMSESEFNARDIEQVYQYLSFGVPDLGYKRGLAESTVIAPYATGLAAMIDPIAAALNYRRLDEIGARGAYGWYEAIDYTSSRVPEGAKYVVVQAYMAHHQAMTILGIANVLHDGAMRARFHAEPIIEAAELLLQERMPRGVALARQPPEQTTVAVLGHDIVPETERRYASPYSRVPRTQLLSNGHYSVMLTAAGSGYSRWRDVAITRWREDTTRDNWGAYIYLRDVRGGDVWSAGAQPSVVPPDRYDVVFHEDRAQINRRDGSLDTTLEVVVSPEHDAEVRRVSLTNHGARPRDIEVTSYAELVLGRQGDDVAHPAFGKLFVQTEFIPAHGVILATRRRRSDSDPRVWAAHLVVIEGEAIGDVQFETDRARFLGRGQTVRTPVAVRDGWPLSNTEGCVLDPIFSLRRRVRIPRGTTARLAFWTIAASTREELLDLVDKHLEPAAYERAATLAWTQAQIQLRHLRITSDDAHLYQRLANHVLYSDHALRPASDALKAGAGKVSTLWSQGISGDLPIVLVEIADEDDLELVRDLLRAHEYWRLKQLPVDLVILNTRASSYIQDLQNALDALVRASRPVSDPRVSGAVFALRADLISAEVRGLIETAARAVLRGGRGSLAQQVNRARDFTPPTAPPPWRVSAVTGNIPPPRQVLEFYNGFGGFSAGGREYTTILDAEATTPAPWINVIANPAFGFQVSTEGIGYTWALNSQQNQITPWSNDPIAGAPGEVLYISDEETGEVWGPTAQPIREKGSTYVATHGPGYSRFTHNTRGIGLELLQFVPVSDAIKISRLRISNPSQRARRLSVTAYVEWVLGTNRAATAPFVITELDAVTGAMLARNPWNNELPDQIAFIDLAGKQSAWTGDRMEFIGRDGGLDRPLGLSGQAPLSGRVGAGFDPCGVLQTGVTLAPGSETEVVFLLGHAGSLAEARMLIARYREADLDAVLAEIDAQWHAVTDAVTVTTPDRAFDILVNHWLPYQTLACRAWARTGFYQASGAYGFRDQLQDVLALCLARPDITRAHLLRAASRQFAEGDVQHWWLPETGRGIRTHVADDRIWLAFAVAHYVEVTGDVGVLDETVPFLEGPGICEGERDAFFEPTISAKGATLFAHCALALDTSLATGAHGLPLMGAGDWNDGMDRVGEGGKGESIWLGWFLHTAMMEFVPIAEARGQTEAAQRWRTHAAALSQALEEEGWDGDWYRRAYFDDGTPLGSVSNSECRIDSIAQSWGVISGAAEPARAVRAMEAVDKYLVRRNDQLVLLFTPPFDHAEPDPGYIKGYPPGVRENGGQYTHAAVWTAYAFAKLGDGDKALEILSLINPIHHSDSHTGVHRYKVEPYVVSADIYSVSPHVGRGGWTWYTGSAGWTWRVALERVLGLRPQGGNLLIDPCVPRSWAGYEMSFRYRGARYDIRVENPRGVSRGVASISLDGVLLSGTPPLIPFANDGGTHAVKVVLG